MFRFDCIEPEFLVVDKVKNRDAVALNRKLIH